MILGVVLLALGWAVAPVEGRRRCEEARWTSAA